LCSDRFECGVVILCCGRLCAAIGLSAASYFCAVADT